METPEDEEYLARLEARITVLEEKFAQFEEDWEKPNATSHAWLDKTFGIFADCPEFEEAVKAGQEWRKT